MRALAVVAALCATAVAEPRPAPDKLARAAGDAFAAAQRADERGDLDEAIRQYRRAHAIAPHPNTLYNLADALRRHKQLRSAADTFEQYLALAPDAPDRAEVRAVIDGLRATPGRVTILVEEPDARVFIDGMLAGTAPVTIDVPAGSHQIDAITPITFGHGVCTVDGGGRNECRITAKPRVDGNVVLSATWTLGGRSWPVEGQRFAHPSRFAAKPGRYVLDVVENPCAPLVLDVPARGFVYAYITHRRSPPGTCNPSSIRQQTL